MSCETSGKTPLIERRKALCRRLYGELLTSQVFDAELKQVRAGQQARRHGTIEHVPEGNLPA